jgi:multisubunit Na+/H+ antiporter MnhE subunit
MINLLFAVIIACLICYVIYRFLPEPVRTVALVVVCVLFLLWVWENLGALTHLGIR